MVCPNLDASDARSTREGTLREEGEGIGEDLLRRPFAVPARHRNSRAAMRTKRLWHRPLLPWVTLRRSRHLLAFSFARAKLHPLVGYAAEPWGLRQFLSSLALAMTLALTLMLAPLRPVLMLALIALKRKPLQSSSRSMPMLLDQSPTTRRNLPPRASGRARKASVHALHAPWHMPTSE